MGLRAAQHDHPDGHNDEREQRADVGQVSERADVEDACSDADHQPRDPRADVGRFIFAMHSRED